MGQAANKALWRFIRNTDPVEKISVKSDDKDEFLVKVYQDVAADLKAVVDIAVAQSIAVTQAVPASLKATVDIAANQSVIAKQTVAANLKATVTQASASRTVECEDGDKIYGFKSILEDTIADNDLDTNVNTINGSVVPPTEVWRITHVAFCYWGTVPSKIIMHAFGLATNTLILDQRAFVSGQWYFWEGELYIQGNDYMQAVITGATATDDFIARVVGLKMTAP